MLEYINSGGFTMYLIILDAIILYSLLFERFIALYTPSTWKENRKAELLNNVHGLKKHTANHENISVNHKLTNLSEHPELTRYLSIIRALIAIAPLLGLFGTVTGIILTFETLGSGGLMSEISEGISLALVTTQFGIAIAIPGLICERLIIKRIGSIIHTHELLVKDILGKEVVNVG